MSRERYTRTDVERAAFNLREAIEAAGIDCPRLVVEAGSQTNGIAWRLVGIDRNDRRVAPPIGTDVLGHNKTARAAYEDLTTRTRCVNDMRRALGIEYHRTTHDKLIDRLSDPAEVKRIIDGGKS